MTTPLLTATTPSIVYPNAVTPVGMSQMISGKYPNWWYDSPSGNIRFHLMGGQSPFPGVQTGIVCKSLKSYDPLFQMQDSQGAHQDGVTFNDAVYEATEFDFDLKTSAPHLDEARAVFADWMDSWDPKKVGKLTRYTERDGHWWCYVRKFKPMPNDLVIRQRGQALTWTARNDLTFMQSTPSVCTFQPGGTGGSGFLTLTNRGDQPAWASHLVYGPFSKIAIGDGPGSTTMITFGPLEAGQIALITTLPRLRSVVDLSPAPVVVSPQNTDLFSEILSGLISFATSGNIEGLLQEFQNFAGIRAPQGVLYSLLTGRFNNPIPAKDEGADPVESKLAVSITGGTSATKIVSSVTPLRRMVLR
jgi:hypothetical protein